MVIYQNEAYSYTPYPGCAWTAEGTVRFNRDYLGPTLRQKHPEVKLYLGTFNTNRVDYVQKIASDTKLQEYVSGMAFQPAAREPLPLLFTICGWKVNADGVASTVEQSNIPFI